MEPRGRDNRLPEGRARPALKGSPTGTKALPATNHEARLRAEDHRARLGAEAWRLAFRQSVLTQAGCFLAMLALWPAPIFNPLKLLVILLHEVGHVLAAYATGGMVFGIALDPGGAAMTLGHGGHLAIIVAGGYVASMLFGALLYYLAAVWEPMEVWCVLAAFLALPQVLRAFTSFTSVFSFLALVLFGLGLFLSPFKKKLIIQSLATASCLFPILDVLAESWSGYASSGFLFNSSPVLSDVSQLSGVLRIPAADLATLWIAVGIFVAVGMILVAARLEAAQARKRSLFRRPPPPPGPRSHQVEENLTYYEGGMYSSEYTIKG